MTSLQRCTCNATFIGLCLAAANGAFAQVSSINSAAYNTRAFNDIPGATLTTVTDYNSAIVFDEHNVSAPTGYANRDVWRFSNNGGTSAYAFANNDYFHVSMTLQLIGTGGPSIDKEAGFLFSTIGGDGQFIVKNDGEIVAFGGPLPFYNFAPLAPWPYNPSDIITLGMTYENVGGVNSIMYSANGVNSPWLAFSNLELGIINGSTLGGYFQIQNDPNNPGNSGAAVFQNISITPVPEPTSFVLLSAGILPLLLRRRRI